jgi:4-diphosphocytidyl-2-C-methyl-D-erythritol kinase
MANDQQSGTVVVWAPAKVNLYLEVLGKRPDGYHEIATLLIAISLFDTLTFRADAAGTVVLQGDEPALSMGPDNLIWRAAELLRQRTGTRLGVRIQLRKRIPLAAGLAGGSTDAAAALMGLNQLWRLNLAPDDLAHLGAELGSDVPFFFAQPVAWCTGRGEVVEPLRLGQPLWFVVACPPVGLSTAAVYRNVAVPPVPETGVAIRQAVAEGRVEAIAAALHNRLEEPAQRLCPAITALRQRFQALGPAGVLMSGSGSSVFALCRDGQEARRIAYQLRTGSEEDRPNVFVVRSCF